mmetsp:Transcript_74431/g.227748  ORF Transcript_74431/g.227748 Transcript_74431/m.227748 type:complete len:211 (+) Transcript_74431:388-1020(+)
MFQNLDNATKAMPPKYSASNAKMLKSRYLYHTKAAVMAKVRGTSTQKKWCLFAAKSVTHQYSHVQIAVTILNGFAPSLARLELMPFSTLTRSARSYRPAWLKILMHLLMSSCLPSMRSRMCFSSSTFVHTASLTDVKLSNTPLRLATKSLRCRHRLDMWTSISDTASGTQAQPSPGSYCTASVGESTIPQPRKCHMASPAPCPSTSICTQ